MQDIDDINGVAARLLTHAQVLTAGAAPHQQQLASDLHALATHVQTRTIDTSKWVARSAHQATVDELALANTTIESMKGDLTRARADRDEAQKEVARLADGYAALIARRDELEAKLEDAKKFGIASTAGDTHADLKDKTKFDHNHKADPNASTTTIRDPAHGGHAHKK